MNLSSGQVAAYYSSRLPELRQRDGGEWRGRCPIHDGNGPNFSVEPATGRWYCHSACARGGDVFALERELAGTDFVAARDAVLERIAGSFSGSHADSANGHAAMGPNGTAGGDTEAAHVRGSMQRDGWRIAAEFPYGPSLRKVRYEHTLRMQAGKARPEKTCRWEHFKNGRWLSTLGNLPVPLFVNATFHDRDQVSRAVGFEGEQKALAVDPFGIVGFCFHGASDDAAFARLSGIDVVLWPDNDDAGAKLAAKRAKQIAKFAESVRIIKPPKELGEAGDVMDAIAMGYDGAAVLRLCDAAVPYSAPVEPEPGNDDPPTILTSGRLADMTTEAIDSIRRANKPPRLFVRSGRMCTVVRDERGSHMIGDVGEAALRGHMARAAIWMKPAKPAGKQNDGPTPVPPPLDVVRDLAALPPLEWGFPGLDAITEVSVLRPDGSVVDSPGYDAATLLYFAPTPGLNLSYHQFPTPRNVEQAVALIDEAIGEFPFSDHASKANAIGCLLTPIIRPAIDAPTPLALFDAPAAGTGKSLLAEVVSIIVCGRGASMLTAPKDPDEWGKKVTMALSSGSALTIFDNVSQPLDADALCQALTSTFVADRIFRTHDQVRLPVKCAWIGTGNNIQVRGDMPRRCYWIRLDAQSSRPFQRNGFRHKDLRAWVHEHRGELAGALLTLARAWFQAGKPIDPNQIRMGSFEKWAEMVSGILYHAGIPGFLANLDQMFDQADVDALQWEGFLRCLGETFYGEPFLVSEVVERLAALRSRQRDAGMSAIEEAAQALRNSLPDVLAEAADKTAGFFQRRLGRCFAERDGRRFGKEQYCLTRAGLFRGAVRWRVSSATEGSCR